MNVLSLFSGCGGMDLGFEGNFFCNEKCVNTKIHNDWVQSKSGNKILLKKTKFHTVFANDIKPAAKNAWVNYFSKFNRNVEKIYVLESIVDIVKSEKNGQFSFPTDIDIVTGGFPCQDFSVSGKRQGFNSLKSHKGEIIKNDEPTAENRGQLYMWMREVVSITQPKMFVAENVKGLTNLADAKNIIENDFSSAANGGYLVVPARVLHSADFGVPQSRERVFFFGFRKDALKEKALNELSKPIITDEYDPYPPKTHSFSEEGEHLNSIVTCRDVLSDLPEQSESEDLAQKKYSKAKYMGKHCQGQAEIPMDSISPTIRSEHHGNIEFRRLNVEHGGMNLDECMKGLEERRLTVRECARIQTFPDDYEFILSKNNPYGPVSATDAYRMIGNAVPCVLAYNIAMRLQSNWNLYFKERCNDNIG